MATSTLKGTLINQIFLQTSAEIGTTPTAFSVNWQNYDVLIIEACQYSNPRETMVIPVSQFGGTSSSMRPIAYDAGDDIDYEVYQNGSGSIYVSASKSDSKLRLRIFGIKFK